MDLFKMELRNIFGILLPGALLLLIIALVSALAPIHFNSEFMWISGNSAGAGAGAGNCAGTGIAAGSNTGAGPEKSNGGHEVLTIVLGFMLSYFLGSLLRLNSAENLDRKSSKANQKRMKKYTNEQNEEYLQNAWNNIQCGNMTNSNESIFSELWARDTFPYPVLQFWRLKKRFPNNLLEILFPIFESIRSCSSFSENKNLGGLKELWKKLEDIFTNIFSAVSPPGGDRKAIFNFCRINVCAVAGDIGEELVREIRSAETEVRYYAGTYYALFCGRVMLMALLVCQIFFSLPFQNRYFAEYILDNHIVLPSVNDFVYSIIALIVLSVANRKILIRFRTLRIKEVDLVFEAYALGVTKKLIPQIDWPFMIS